MDDIQGILQRLGYIEADLAVIRKALQRLSVTAEAPTLDIDPETGVPIEHPVAAVAASGVLEVVNGVPTTDFPDCCAVGSDTRFTCTGTLIAPNVVVTADHCKNVARVFLKGSDVKQLDQGEVIAVKAMFSHPEVDLKVLVLAQDSTVTPRRVAQAADIAVATKATAVGFGTYDPDGLEGYGTKRQTPDPVTISTRDCSEPGAPKQYGCLPGREVVAGHHSRLTDTCRGDSGGPLYIQGADGEYVLLGATSRGARGGFTNCGYGGIYVRVDLCLDWIREVTGVTL
jgi:secreted trypsin-like serine protease